MNRQTRAVVPGRRTTPPPPNEVVNPPPVRRAGELIAANDRLMANSQVIKAAFFTRGYDECIDLVNLIQNPADAGVGGTNYSVSVVNFTVPDGQVAIIDKIALVVSEPTVARCIYLGWRLTVNGNRVPNLVTAIPGFADYNPVSFGSIYDPISIEPLYIQSGQVVSLDVVPVLLFQERVTVIGRIAGRLVKPASPELPGGMI